MTHKGPEDSSNWKKEKAIFLTKMAFSSLPVRALPVRALPVPETKI